MLSVTASSHQCHTKYFGQGRQCVANSYAAMYHHLTVKKASKWTQEDLDEILLKGDNVYYNVMAGGQKENYLLVSDLPNKWSNCELKVLRSDAGSISSVEPCNPYVSLHQTIREIESFLFLTIKCYTTAIIKENGMYHVFDPHSRNRNGMVDADGKAVLTSHCNFENLILFLETFAASLGDPNIELIPFEATYVEIVENICTDTSESDDFEGFSDKSEGEYSCMLQIIQDTKDEQIRNIEEELELSSLGDDTDSEHSLMSVNNDHELTTAVSSEDDIPLSKLSKILKSKTLTSDSEHISSDSEYQFSHLDKKMLNESNSDPSLSDSDPVKKKKNKNKRRKFKKSRKVYDIRTQFNDVDESVSTNGLENINCSKVERGSRIKVNDETLMAEGEEIVSDIVESEQWIGLENEDITEYNTMEEVVYPSQIQFESGHHMQDHDFDIAAEVIIEGVFGEEIVDQSESQYTVCENEYDIEVGQELDIDGETVTTDVGNSMEELAGLDVSYEGCASGNGIRTEHARGRMRTRNPENWKRNKAKRNCNTGHRYINVKGKIQQARKIKKGCGQDCRFKCHSVFTEDDREDIFQSYWKLADATRQRQFLLQYSAPQKKKSYKNSSTVNQKRVNSFMWSLPLNGINIRVCKTFFIHTLNVSPQRVHTALKKSQNSIQTVELDYRGSHSNRPNRTPQDNVDFVVSHIKSIPAVESHYCRKDSKKMYLSPDLSVAQMYRLYLEQCTQNEIVSPVSLNLYRNIFNTHFNIAFQKPMKDQCDLCNSFKNASEADKMIMKEKYDGHIKNKLLARENKEQDKNIAQEKNDETFLAACFDLEEVLMTPKAFESSLYYKRRLNTFNFSIYDLGSSEAYCYLWNESISGRGACEISSSVFDFLVAMSKKGKKKFVFYSDNCGAQNKNKHYVSMLWYTIQTFNLESIEHKYLEKGHTQNENDSVHACIERASRQICVYTPAQWASVIRTARRKKPYHVKEMDLPNFFDFKSVSKLLKNFDLDLERNKVLWTDVRSFKIESSNPNTVVVKYDYNGPLHYLDLAHRIRRSNTILNVNNIVLNRLHKEYPKITFEKYKDLIVLCRTGVIPHSHHMFYAVLSHEIPD